MRILTATQGTPEWFAARLGRATGSRFADVMAKGQGKTRHAYAVELALETITGEPAPTVTTQDMQNGIEREPIARSLYEIETGNCVEQVGFCLHDTLHCGVSPDGFVELAGGTEIKCPKPATHAKYLLMKAEPPIYTPQIQGNLWVTEREWWDFISYCPTFPENARLIVRRIYRDETYIKQLAKEVELFCAEVQQQIESILNYHNKEVA